MFKKTLITGALVLTTLASSALPAFAAVPAVLPPVPPAQAAVLPVTPAEAASLQFMREEEKLAHDVYVTLAARWDLAIFANIAASEQQHTDVIAALLERYGIPDPAAATGPGEFTNADLQALYDTLVAQGSQSEAEALKVGALVEEVDIVDLQDRLAETGNPSIAQVYGNLMSASENHLRAFVKNLELVAGETYAPQVLSQEAFDAIIASSGNRGGNGRGANNGGGKR